MPIIKVEMFAGRSREKKRALAKALTDAFVESCGGAPQSVQIIIADVDKEDWGIGGALAVDLYPDAMATPAVKQSREEKA
jgi:4-oxalocrotonate tautomerase